MKCVSYNFLLFLTLCSQTLSYVFWNHLACKNNLFCHLYHFRFLGKNKVLVFTVNIFHYLVFSSCNSSLLQKWTYFPIFSVFFPLLPLLLHYTLLLQFKLAFSKLVNVSEWIHYIFFFFNAAKVGVNLEYEIRSYNQISQKERSFAYSV